MFDAQAFPQEIRPGISGHDRHLYFATQTTYSIAYNCAFVGPPLAHQSS